MKKPPAIDYGVETPEGIGREESEFLLQIFASILHVSNCKGQKDILY